MNHYTRIFIAFALTLLLVTSGCLFGPNYEKEVSDGFDQQRACADNMKGYVEEFCTVMIKIGKEDHDGKAELNDLKEIREKIVSNDEKLIKIKISKDNNLDRAVILEENIDQWHKTNQKQINDIDAITKDIENGQMTLLRWKEHTQRWAKGTKREVENSYAQFR